MPQEKRIVQVCEDIFLYLCDLNRLRREGIPANSSAVKFEVVYHRVKSLLTECQEKAEATNNLQEQWNKIERPLCCFLDSMIEEILGARDHEDALPALTDWIGARLAEEKFAIVNGENAFFNFLQADLALRGNDMDARERLEFYYACLGLGFSGQFRGNPDGLNACKQEVAARVQHLLNTGTDDRLVTPSAYKHNVTDNLNFEPAPVIWGVALVTAVVIVFFFVATSWLYKSAVSDLNIAIKDINKYGDQTQGLH
jgi:type IV/VI secretion system ImpK/VasF family protein